MALSVDFIMGSRKQQNTIDRMYCLMVETTVYIRQFKNLTCYKA